MSDSTPILMTLSEICACAAPAAKRARDRRARAGCVSMRFIDAPPYESHMRCGAQTPRYSCSLPMFAIELGVRDHVDDPAVLHHVMPIRDGGREAEILLDQQDREALLLQLARSCAPICWTITGARPSVGSSSSSSRAPVRRMRPIASICCSPPDSFVPWLLRRSAQVRKQLVDLLDRQAAVAHLRRQHQVLLDVQAREDAALLRAPGDAAGARSGSTAGARSPAARRRSSPRAAARRP